MIPGKHNDGWMILVTPNDSKQDYAYPLNPPLHSWDVQGTEAGRF